MKRLLYILQFVPLALFGQEQSPCYSVNDYNISILENNPPLTMNLNEGWNMIGYPCADPIQVEDAMLPLVNEISLLKDNNGDVYWPEYGFNGIGSLKQLNGYQINLHESVESFSFCNSFEIVERFGCTDCEAFNFDIWATSNDGSCENIIFGCTNYLALNYNPNANTDEGNCIELVFGCNDNGEPFLDSIINSSGASGQDGIDDDYQYDLNNDNLPAFNYSVNATITFNCISIIEGCLNPLSYNYEISANTDDGSCEAVVEGCTDATAFNYNAAANTDDNSCMFLGCTDANYFEYNILASQDDGSCQTLKIYGCIYPLAVNFNENANTEDGSCIFYETPTGETNVGECDLPVSTALNTGTNMTVMFTTSLVSSLNATEQQAYLVALTQSGLVIGSTFISGDIQTSLALFGDDSVTQDVDGAVANEAISWQLVNGNDLYDVVMPTAVSFVANGLSVQNGAAQLTLVVCNSTACPYDVFLEYMPNADNYDIEYCVNLIVEGCTGDMYFEFNPDANVEDGSCLTLIVEGCTDATFVEYNVEANQDNGSCLTLAISGCTNPDGNNYNPNANTDDGSCIVLGCMEMTAANYNTEATENDGSCIYYGCINSTAENFELSANTDDGSCIIYGCALSVFPNYNSQATIDDGSCDMSSTDVFGCTVSEANNYDELATIDNGSCGLQVGDLAEGGIVFYVDETGEHGLVAAMEDLGIYQWGCYGTDLAGAYRQAIGTGYQNTLDIVSGCSETPIAASEALAYESEGYSDWYIPSKDELYEMYSTIGQGGLEGNIGGFGYNSYWSSSEGNNALAWGADFSNGNSGYTYKFNSNRVRVIRAF